MNLSILFFIAISISFSCLEAETEVNYNEYNEYDEYDEDDDEEEEDRNDDDDEHDFSGNDDEYDNEGKHNDDNEDASYDDEDEEGNFDDDSRGSEDLNSYGQDSIYSNEGLCEETRRKMKDEDEDDKLPTCTEDGRYEVRQCDKNDCWCVEKDGVELKGSRKKLVHSTESQCEEVYSEQLMSELTHKFDVPASNHPAFLVAVILLAMVGLTGAVMVSMFVVYRMRKKDEGSYALANNNNHNNVHICNKNNGNVLLNNNNYPLKDSYPLQQQHALYNYNIPQQQALQQEFYA